MAKPAPMIPVSPKLYRHFAMATVMITACLAVFADGEKRQEIEDMVASRQQQNEAQAEQEAKERKQITFSDKRKNKGQFGRDGIVNVPVTESAVDVGFAELGPGSQMPGYQMPGSQVPDSLLEKNPEDELLDPEKVKGKKGIRKLDPAEVDRIIADSKARSQAS